MEQRIEERNQKFMKNTQSEYLTNSFNNSSVALRKQKRLAHINSNRKNLKTTPFSLPPHQTLDQFIKIHKDILKTSSAQSEVFNTLTSINQAINRDTFPFSIFFDSEIIQVYKAFINQSEDPQLRRLVLANLVNTTAASLLAVEKFLEIGILDCLINIAKLCPDSIAKKNAVLAIGNIHDFKPDCGNYFIITAFWEDLLRLTSSTDQGLTAATLWALTIYFKKRSKPSLQMTQKIFENTLQLFRSRDLEVLIEITWLMVYMMNEHVEIMHLFVRHNFLQDLMTYIMMPSTKLASPACRILAKVISFGEKYCRVLIDMGFVSRIAVSFESTNASYQIHSLYLYSLLLGASEEIATQLISESEFCSFCMYIGSVRAVSNQVIFGLERLVSYKNLQITRHLLRIDVLKSLIHLLKVTETVTLEAVLNTLTNIFELLSHQSEPEYSKLLDYFVELNGIELLKDLSLMKSFKVQNDAKAFIESFYGKEIGNLLAPTESFNF